MSSSSIWMSAALQGNDAPAARASERCSGWTWRRRQCLVELCVSFVISTNDQRQHVSGMVFAAVALSTVRSGNLLHTDITKTRRAL
jgi:hypothetical protein